MTQKYEPVSWLNPEDRIQGTCDKIEAGPMKILHQKESLWHTIEISPLKPGTPLGEEAHSMTLEMGVLDIEICYVVLPGDEGKKWAFALRIQYRENLGHLMNDSLMLDELPPCEEDSLDTKHDTA